MSEYRGSAGPGLSTGPFVIDGAMLLPGMAGGLRAYAASDARKGSPALMAVQAEGCAPARSIAITALSGVTIENVLAPLAVLADVSAPAAPDGGPALYVICGQPPGPALDAHADGIRPWREGELLDCVVRPVATVLARLAELRTTHRAIRPNNLFQLRHGAPVTLGCAWAAPPAFHQPAVFEPPYAAMCHASGRGDGTVADDIYALGVLLITLATGSLPLAELAPEEVLRRKLELGSFAALTEKRQLPPMISDLVRGMLAEDPAHRPTPALLADPLAARARRVSSRPLARAQHSIEIGGHPVWNARGLAYALSRDPDAAQRLHRGFGVDTWLRRGLGDPILAGRLDEVVRPGAREPGEPVDPGQTGLTVLQAISVLDPLAPLTWRGLTLFPTALGAVMASDPTPAPNDAGPEHDPADIAGLIQSGAIDVWNALHAERVDAAVSHKDGPAHRMSLRMAGWGGGLARLRYALNPLLPCRSPQLGSLCVARLAELLPALERAGAIRAERVIDREMGAFIATHMPGRIDADLAILGQPEASETPPAQRGLAQLRILSQVQERMPMQEFRLIAQAAAASAAPALAAFRHRRERESREQALQQAIQQGNLTRMLQILEDPPAFTADTRAAEKAQADIQDIEGQLATLNAIQALPSAHAQAEGQQIAGALGVMALVVALLLVLLT